VNSLRIRHFPTEIICIKYADSAVAGKFGKIWRVNLAPTVPDTCSTTEAAQQLGMAVRSVQLMVDRGELQAWKTPGGHRRILRSSLDAWLATRAGPASTAQPADARAGGRPMTLLLIEDSVHFQNLIGLVVKRELPEAELHVASDGIAGLAMAGRLEPDVLLIDILLPGIDGAALITSLRSHPQFARSRLIVVTALDEAQRAPYAFALEGVPLVFASGPDDPAEAVEPLIARFRAAGARQVVITCGKRGSFYDDGGSVTEAGSVPVDVVDTCGAGDSFIATFITSRFFQERSGRAALDLAAERASETCTHLGGFPQPVLAIPQWLLAKYDDVIRGTQRTGT